MTLIPFRKISFKDKLFISWVGLRGAVPIIFAILPLAEGVPHASWIFNIVFVITIVSLLVQGTSLPMVARWLGLAEKPTKYKDFEDFDVEFAEEIKSAMTEILISEETLQYGKNLMEMPLPDKTLAVMIKRGEQYFVPTGQTELHAGDKLLVIPTMRMRSGKPITTSVFRTIPFRRISELAVSCQFSAISFGGGIGVRFSGLEVRNQDSGVSDQLWSLKFVEDTGSRNSLNRL